jgi:multiple sugar transport system permease protein
LKGIIGVLVALLLNQKFIGRNVLRVLVILPWALPTIVNAMMWRLNFNPDYGSINALLSQLGIIDGYRSWLGSPEAALNAVMFADIWKNYPLVTLLVLAALQSIPEDLFEAARLDGASAWRRFRAITFPAIVAPLGVALVLRTIDAFKIFDIIYVMTRGGPGGQHQNPELFRLSGVVQLSACRQRCRLRDTDDPDVRPSDHALSADVMASAPPEYRL